MAIIFYGNYMTEANMLAGIVSRIIVSKLRSIFPELSDRIWKLLLNQMIPALTPAQCGRGSLYS